MKILRYGISDDTFGTVPRDERSWYLAERKLAEATGKSWETTIEAAWPSRAWPSEVDMKLGELAPDLVLVACAAFWVSYPSTPLKLHRSALPGGRQLARFGFWAASKPLLRDRALFHMGRRFATTASTVAFFFEPDSALERVEKVIRTVLRHEQTALAVRGPLPLTISGPASVRAVCEQRRAAFDRGLADLCRTHHVEYTGFTAKDAHPPDELLGDRVHVNAKGHARRAEQEFEVMLRAWNAHTAGSGD